LTVGQKPAINGQFQAEDSNSMMTANLRSNPTLRKFLVLAAYACVFAIYTWPLALHINTHLLGVPGDNYVGSWFLWWWKYALEKGVSPFFTSIVFYPHGLNLMGTSSIPLLAIPSIPFQALFGFPAAYNIIALISVALGAYLMYLVALRFGWDQPSAVLTGFVFAFAPVFMIRALGHLNLLASFQIPLVILALQRIEGSTIHRWVLNGLLFGSAMAAAAYVDLGTTLYLVPLTFLWFLREFIRTDNRGRLSIILTGSLGVLCFTGLFSPILFRLSPMPTSPFPLENRADLAAFFVPSGLSPFFHSLVSPLYDRIFGTGPVEGMCYLGWSVLALSLYGIVKGYKKDGDVRWWFWVVIVYLILGIGDTLQVGGGMVSIGKYPLHLPLYFIRKAPVLSSINHSARIIRLAMPGLAWLAGYGFRQFRNRFSGQSVLVTFCCFALVFLDFFTAPFPLAVAGVSPVYQRLRNGHGEGTLFLPLEDPGRTAEWPMAKMNMPIPTPNAYIGTHFRQDDWIGFRDYYNAPLIRACVLWEKGTRLGPETMEGLRLETPSFLRRYQIGRIVVLSEAAKPEVLQSLQFITGTQGEAINSDFLFDTGRFLAKNLSPLQGNSRRVVAVANLLLAYDSRSDLQSAYPAVRPDDVCSLAFWASGGISEERSLSPFATTYRELVSTAECNTKAPAEVESALRSLIRKRILPNSDKYLKPLLALRGIYDLRPDLQRVFPDWSQARLCGLAAWAATSGVREAPQILLPFVGDYQDLDRACSRITASHLK
jgi:hypothetical protein